jgi:hypothetical protein
MIMGRWSELSFLSTFQVVVGIKLDDAIETSGAVEARLVTLVGRS